MGILRAGDCLAGRGNACAVSPAPQLTALHHVWLRHLIARVGGSSKAGCTTGESGDVYRHLVMPVNFSFLKLKSHLIDDKPFSYGAWAIPGDELKTPEKVT